MPQPVTNPALADLEVLIGEWRIEIVFPSDPPSTVHGRAFFDRFEGGAFLVMRSEIDWAGPGGSVSVIGRDDAGEDFSMLYFDVRGVSRIYAMSFRDGVLRQWRDAPGFSQRFTGKLSEDRHTMAVRWEKSADDVTWELDFNLTYRRVTNDLSA